MSRSVFKNSAAVIVVAFLQLYPAVAGTYRELVPTPRSLTDDEQEMAFYLGPLVFQIKNKDLVVPFPRHGRPFDASVCAKSGLSDFDFKSCADQPKAVFLQIPLSAAGTDDAGPYLSHVILGYKQKYNFFEGSVDDFVSQTTKYDGGHVREPSLDTKEYAAVRSLPKKEFENLPNWRQIGTTTVFFIAKDKQIPHVIICVVKLDQKDVPPDKRCRARTWFLTNEFPEQKDGRYAYSLDYGFLAAKIDQAPLIESAVINAVLKFPRSHVKWPADQP